MSTEIINEYECALSGAVVEGDEHFDKDGLQDLPEGWTRVTLERRVLNPTFEAIQSAMFALIQAQVMQIPEEIREANAWLVQVQVEAQFAALLGQTPRFLSVKEEVFISNDAAIAADYNELRETLGLEPVFAGPEDEGEPDTPDEGDSSDEDEDEDGDEG